MLTKKGEWGWEEISKIIIALIVLAVLVLLAFTFKDKILDLIEKLKDIFNAKR
tara:strand:- start:137 stop:295 length:159 start_codon:yes stop_codon:yes gene_type:complete